MASRTPFRPIAGAAKSCLRRSSRTAGSSPITSAARTTTSTSTTTQHAHPFTTQSVTNPGDALDSVDVPRWKQTPKAMTAPVRARPLNPRNVWKVNEDPRALEEAYMKLLGRNGHKILPEDVMWLAVTHKSFDHGRRGFNDRLAFYGKRLLDMQATLAMLSIPTAIKTTHDKYGRPPFIPAALASVGLLDETKKSQLAGKKRLADIAVQCGFDSVIRWKPKQTRDLKASGLDGILTHTMYAIVGALALHRGGAAANELVREKLMMPVSPLPRETEAETAAETSA